MERKYKKYKTKYLNLKKIINKEYNFYFMHSTTVYQNLLNILKIGVIYPGKYVAPEQRKLSGEETESDYVFTNIYFEDIENIKHFQSYSLILHPKIIEENGFIFNKNWGAGPTKDSIYINPQMNSSEINYKLKEIRNFLKNPIGLPDIIQQAPGFMHHEVLFDHPINLSNGNLIGIVCNYCDASIWDWKTFEKLGKPSDEELILIKKTIMNKPYNNTKIFTRNSPLPKLNELLIV